MTDDAIRRALGYPYAIPDHAYVLIDDAVTAIDQTPDLAGRHPVIACGSNQSPEQLSRKFAGRGLGAIPVLETWLADVDAVYSAHVSRYGAFPATPAAAPGVTTRFFITWLTEAQLDRMHETEAVGQNYVYGRMDGVLVQHHGRGVSDHCFAYVSRWGCLQDKGRVISLAAIEAKGRTTPAWHQEDVQRLALERVSPGLTLDAFIRGAVDDGAERRHRTERLSQDAAHHGLAQFTVLLGGD